jgi:MFS family permease
MTELGLTPGSRSGRVGRAGLTGLLNRPWWVVSAFWLCLMVATIDRQIVAVAGKAIQADLRLSDGQLGFIQGPAFAFCAAFGGVPVGWLLDRLNRVRVSASCFAIWSAATSLTAAAASFPFLAVVRGVGAIGEAGLAPAALSIYADIFSAKNVARASAIFLTAPLVGMGAGLAIGGMLLDLFTRHIGAMPPLLAHFAPWQLVYLVAGLPGLLLAAGLATLIRDPGRPASAREAAPLVADDPTLDPVDRRGLILFAFGMTALVVVLYVQVSWLPMRFLRSFGLSAARTGLLIGPSYMAGTLLGAALAGGLAGAAASHHVLRRALGIVLAASLLLAPPLVLADMAPDLWLAMGAFFAGAVLLGMTLALSSVPVQLCVPRTQRARALALMTVSFNVIGAGGGPLIAGLLSDRLTGHANAIGEAMAITSVSGALVAILLLWWARRTLAATRALERGVHA